MLFGKGDEFYHDESGNIYGPDVKLVMTMFNGDRIVKMLPAAIAVLYLLHNDLENGVEFYSGHIEYGNVIDTWGGSI